MKFKYYITNTMDGFVQGCNGDAAAKTYAEDDTYFVVEAETGKWLQPDGTLDDVEAISEEQES